MTAGAIIGDPARVLRDRLPMIDLRAPAEFVRGAFPGAVNLPLLTDAERAAVGTRYKECGAQAAIALGESLVAGATRSARIEAWRAFVAERPDTLLYCWRGGLRSEIAQRWLHEAGVDVPRVAGGYKALRQACLDATRDFCASDRLLVIGGRTGSGKTQLLNEFAPALDLERLANHRGSAFGARASGQPTPIAFENALAVEMLAVPSGAVVLIEDESRTIGRLALPEPLLAAMQRAPLAVVDVSRAERARRIYDEYVVEPRSLGVPVDTLHARFVGAVDRIRRRLGGDRHVAVRATIEAAFRHGDAGAHLVWIEQLLDWYYDPMYDHQLTTKRSRVLVEGDREMIRDYLRTALAADGGTTARPASRYGS